MENFDAVGAWRAREGGVPIDASGELADGTRGGRRRSSCARRSSGSPRCSSGAHGREADDLRAGPRADAARHAGRARASCARRRPAATGSRRSCSASSGAPRFRCGMRTPAAPPAPERGVDSQMTWLTKKRISRRHVLRGMGAAVALPLLDAMVPAATALAQTAASPRAALRRRLRAQRRDHGAVDAGRHRRRVRVLAHPEAARAVPPVAGRRHQPHAGQPGRGRGRPRGQRGRMADGRLRRSAPRPRTCATAPRSIRWWPRRSARRRRSRRSSWPPRTSPATSAPAPRVQLRLHEHHLVEHADDAAADGDQPARGLRADVRAAGHRRRSARRAACATAASSTRSRSEAAELQQGSGRRDRARLGDYLDNVREIERRIQRTEAYNADASRGRWTADRRAGVVRRARVADVRPAGGGLPGRPDARLHVHDGPRAEPAHVSGHRRHRAAPHRVAPRQRPGRTSPERAKINTYHVALFAKFLEQAAQHARRRRVAARSLADRLRRRHGQPQRARQRPAAARGGGRRRGPGNRHVQLAPRTPIGNLWLSVAQHFGAERSTFGDSTGTVDVF